MTREEAITVLKQELSYLGGGPSPNIHEYEEALSVAISTLKRLDETDINVGSKWISVKDRLPEVRQRVLCVGSNGTIYVATNWLDWPDGTISFEVPELDRWVLCTCWMPLPEPIKEEV